MTSHAQKTAFVAGASGAIGKVLCRLLLRDGWVVHGATRSQSNAVELQALGVIPAIVDVFDGDALIRHVSSARPDVVVHQLTDLPKQFTPESLAASRAATARIREVGTANLVSAAVASGAKRVVAQSIAFAYAPGPQPYSEDAPLDASLHSAVIKLEELVLGSGLEGLVLRYGRLYGPNTWASDPPDQLPVHVDAAADAARRAMTAGRSGAYNVAEDGSVVTNHKARQELGWNPAFREATQ
ncbi:MAG: NAD-dependent epimerase/dehydratase family protein [Burkholderiaceae bacterium]